MKKSNKKQDAGKNISGSWQWFLPASILLIAAIIARRYGPPSFYDLNTIEYSAVKLCVDAPDVFAALFAKFKELFPLYLKNYILPSFLLLLPAIILFSTGFDKIRKNNKDYFSFIERPKNEKIFLVVLCAIAFFGTIAIHFAVLDIPPVSDEFCYMFQADLLSSGKIYAESPPMKEFFNCFSVINDGKWYSKVTIGWPLLLAAGHLIGLDFIANSILTALIILLLYFISKRLFGYTGGVVAAFLALLSPFVIFLGGTIFPHISAGFFVLLYIYMLLKTSDEKSLYYPLFAGISLAAATITRPADGALLFIGTLPFAIYLIYKSEERKNIFKKITVFMIPVLICAGVMMYINLIQNGSPMTFGYQKYDSEEKWGFGHNGHTPLKGLWNVTFEVMRGGFWTAPFICLLGIISLFMRNRKSSLLLIHPLLYLGFFMCWFSLGDTEIGPRFYLPAFLVLIISASGSTVFIRELWKKSGLDGWRSFIQVFIGTSAIFMFFAVFTFLFYDIHLQYNNTRKLTQWLNNPHEIKEKAILFLKDDSTELNSYNKIMTHNLHKYKDQDVIRVLYLNPEENEKFASLFPDRKTYMLCFDGEKHAYSIKSPVDNTRTVANYTAAGRNYWHCLNDEKDAEKVYLEAIKIEPNNPAPIWNLIILYVTSLDYEKAIPYCRQISSFKGYEDTPYLTGKLLGLTEKKEEAIKELENFAKNVKDPHLAAKARQWIEDFRK